MNKENSIIIATYPDKETAKKAAKLLVESRFAASVQMFPVESIYRWKGKIYEENEIVLSIRTKTAKFDEVSAFIKKNHSYEVPEIIEFPITDGLPEYLNWIGECVESEIGD